MAQASDYIKDVRRYVSDADENRVQKICNYLGIALANRDSSLVSCSDPTELNRVRDGYAAKKLGMDKPEAEDAISAVCDTMKGDRNKQRVTFYYLMAKNADKLADL